mgnify:CR=1 FL=1
MKLSFELLVAARYLRADRPKGALDHLRWATLVLVILTVAVFASGELVEYLLRDHLSETLWNLRGPLRAAKYITVLVTLLVGFFIELIRRLTIFTTISTFGLFLGTGALVTVLSVMSGFEQDLKTKILGTHAHMVVSTPDRSFTDYREALALLGEAVALGADYVQGHLSLGLILLEPPLRDAAAARCHLTQVLTLLSGRGEHERLPGPEPIAVGLAHALASAGLRQLQEDP